MNKKLVIRESTHNELEDVLAVEWAAFDTDEETNLVRNLFCDPSAKPYLSLLALMGHQSVGHILFTNARLDPDSTLSISILGPLAVIPSYQKKGIGEKLIRRGLGILTRKGIDLVFVLGHTSYYPRFGFTPAIAAGFEPPYPIESEFTDAWMVHVLNPACEGSYRGKVLCADTFDDPKYWGE